MIKTLADSPFERYNSPRKSKNHDEWRPIMANLVRARAFCNNEVAYLAWQADGKIDGCLGFMITRIHLDDKGNEVYRRILPAWVAFETQSNPDWEEQDTSVWPVQKYSWRDLTLRKSRDK